MLKYYKLGKLPSYFFKKPPRLFAQYFSKSSVSVFELPPSTSRQMPTKALDFSKKAFFKEITTNWKSSLDLDRTLERQESMSYILRADHRRRETAY